MASEDAVDVTQQHGNEVAAPSKNWWLETFRTGALADLTFRFGDTTVRAHKKRLSEKSQYWKEALNADGASNEIDIGAPNDREKSFNAAKAFESAVQYCYTGDYSTPDYSVDSAKQLELTYFHGFVHRFANKFQIDGLAEYAADKYAAAVAVFSAKHDDDTVFVWIRDVFAFELTDKVTRLMMLEVAAQEFETRMGKLEAKNEHKEMVKRMKEVPAAAANFYTQMQTSKTVDETETPQEVEEEDDIYQWECFACKTTFSYTSDPERENLKLQICPCCPNANEFNMSKVPARNNVRTRSRKRKKVFEEDEEEDD
ncbi:hypothetical protein BDV96DRAFT_688404 [Lophiotrema nucula]|uniref:BTB domain-containing protein n=1 Tax=Lophiotrema nucula TaxID=690887 RepID=A0A6A5Z5R5_9PLEO|nr:hypothetical protein BDV96DRAFT_688404 [Lophiotrema nucula]